MLSLSIFEIDRSVFFAFHIFHFVVSNGPAISFVMVKTTTVMLNQIIIYGHSLSLF